MEDVSEADRALRTPDSESRPRSTDTEESWRAKWAGAVLRGLEKRSGHLPPSHREGWHGKNRKRKNGLVWDPWSPRCPVPLCPSLENLSLAFDSTLACRQCIRAER